MAKTRQLSEPEQKARSKRDGLTRRDYNAKHSKFAKQAPKTEAGDFEIVATFVGNPVPQTAPFPNLAAALARFSRLGGDDSNKGNPDILDLRIIQNKVIRNDKGEVVELRREAIYGFQRGGNQEFANSKVETLWKQSGSNGATLSMKQIRQSPKLTVAYTNGELEIAKQVVTGGQAWWERRA